MTDRELLELIYQDEIAGISSLIDTYSALIYNMVSQVLSSVGTDDDAEECVADSFMAFYNNIDDVDLERADIKGYLGVLAKRRAINLYYTIKPDADAAFDEYTVEEMSDMLEKETVQPDSELSQRIKKLCLKEIAPGKVLEKEAVSEETEALPTDKAEEVRETGRVIISEKTSRFGRVLKTAVSMIVLVAVITVGVIAFDRLGATKKEQAATTTTTQPTTQEEPYNPLLSAIISGNESLIESLIGNSLLLTQDVLQFAIESADKISYDSIRRIAEEVRNKYGSTGLDPILEGAIFGDPQDIFDKLKDKDEDDMTPAEKLARHFVEAFAGTN